MIASVNKTKEILDKYSISAKKRYGQNFLIDSNIVKKIVETAGVDESTIVIEIGPGLGSMTEELIKKANKVICFEVDHDMVNILTNELQSGNIEINEKDFLKVDLNEYLADNYRTIVVSNLPYYITTPILSKLTSYESVSEIYVMVQDEVALRIASLPGTKDYGSFTVLMNYYYDCKYEFKVSRNCFYPSPNVDSAIVSMKRAKRDYGLNNEDKFVKFVHSIFENRRKTLINNIMREYHIEKDKIERTIREIGYSIDVRSEKLSINDIVSLYKGIGL